MLSVLGQSCSLEIGVTSDEIGQVPNSAAFQFFFDVLRLESRHCQSFLCCFSAIFELGRQYVHVFHLCD